MTKINNIQQAVNDLCTFGLITCNVQYHLNFWENNTNDYYGGKSLLMSNNNWE
jgi:hypothetical protein